MFARLSVLALIWLELLHLAVAQTTTLNIFPGDPDLVHDLQGEIEGTGADGTTFAVSGIVSGVTATATIVRGASYLSEVVIISTSGVEAEIREECGLNDQNVGTCTLVMKGDAGSIETATTAVGPATVTFAPVALDITPNNSAAPTVALAMSVFALAPLLGFAIALW